jgi:uncharacterized membrane protein
MDSNRGRPPGDFGPDEETEEQDSSSQDEAGYLDQQTVPKKKKRSAAGSSKTSLRAQKGMTIVPAGQTVYFELPFNIAAALCYVLPPAVGIVWLLTENTQTRYLRFHCVQSIIVTGIMVAINVLIGTVNAIISIIPMVGPAMSIVFSLFGGLFSLLFLGICFRVAFGVWKGKEGRLPFIADIADRYAEPPN